jgi:hypothetical protein
MTDNICTMTTGYGRLGPAWAHGDWPDHGRVMVTLCGNVPSFGHTYCDECEQYWADCFPGYPLPAPADGLIANVAP